MKNLVFLFFIILLGCCLFYIQKRRRLEGFISLFKDKHYYVDGVMDTSYNSLQYKGCVGFTSQEYNDDKRLENAPFYVVHQNISRFIHIDSILVKELQHLQEIDRNIGTVGVLVHQNNDATVDVYMLFPNFTKERTPITSYSMLSKSHWWYHKIMFTNYYKSNILCTKSHCNGMPMYSKTSNKFVFAILAKEYYHYTNRQPCGGNGSEGNAYNKYPKERFYAYYVPNIQHAMYRNFKITPYPNVSILSEYGRLRQGCSTQLVSENLKYSLRLGPPGKNGLTLYHNLSGDPLFDCREGRNTSVKSIWHIPAYTSYTRLRLDNNKVSLYDTSKVIWEIDGSGDTSPSVMKLSDTGALEFYDGKNKLVRRYTIDDMLQTYHTKKYKDLQESVQRSKVDTYHKQLQANKEEDTKRQKLLEEEGRKKIWEDNRKYGNPMGICPMF